ncbi:uncharacterized protein LOC111040071 isoform X1 [Myzus persicae]|uniref:uncharacterized protein LOC111040071 isoform X1 n=2 Tax=Myzus persicae TaxID=13164 RepID=UPI000B935354|nr:uncharacterized protein LOC111040071 isoform X1 [Myzus persicae]
MNNSAVPDIVAEWDTDSDSETKLCDSQNTDSTVIGTAVDFQRIDQSMSGRAEDKRHEKNDIDTSNSAIEPDEDVVNGTPDRCHVSNPVNRSLRNGNIVISYTNVEDCELEILQELVDLFELDARVSWSDSVTHLIVKTLPTGRCIRTKKFMNALLLNCFIITLEWAKNCLASKTLLPEVDYIPLEFSGEPSPLVSWRVGRGIIDSPMEWTRNCILYLHSSIEFNDSHNDIIVWARRAGFVLTNDLGEFKDHYKMRVILADKIFTSNDVRAKLPNKAEITNWICHYKAVTLFLDWFLECLFQYRFVVVSQYHQIMKLNPTLVDFTNMDESIFQYET